MYENLTINVLPVEIIIMIVNAIGTEAAARVCLVYCNTFRQDKFYFSKIKFYDELRTYQCFLGETKLLFYFRAIGVITVISLQPDEQNKLRMDCVLMFM